MFLVFDGIRAIGHSNIPFSLYLPCEFEKLRKSLHRNEVFFQKYGISEMPWSAAEFVVLDSSPTSQSYASTHTDSSNYLQINTQRETRTSGAAFSKQYLNCSINIV